MDTDLNEIKNLFNRTEKHRLTKRLIALTLALLLIGAGGLALRPRGKTSKMAIYKALKAHFKYETISKMRVISLTKPKKS